jgi:hypothetical protein
LHDRFGGRFEYVLVRQFPVQTAKPAHSTSQSSANSLLSSVLYPLPSALCLLSSALCPPPISRFFFQKQAWQHAARPATLRITITE